MRFQTEKPSRPTAGSLWPQVQDQRAAYHTEAEARREECNKHGGREHQKDNERSPPRHAPRTLGHWRGGYADQYFALKDV